MLSYGVNELKVDPGWELTSCLIVNTSIYPVT